MLKRLTITAFILAMIVVTLGALTRLLDAGLGCPDWPGCYGQIIPPQHHPETATLIDGSKAWMEMIHRYVAGLLGLIILALAICIEKTKGLAKKTRWLSRGILALVIAQALFGMWTVTMQLLPQIVTLHLLGGMLLLSLLWLLLVQLQGTKPVIVPPQMHKGAFVVLLLLFSQIALGGWTSSQYAGLACPDFPTCQGRWLPQLELRQAFDITDIKTANYEGGLLSSSSRVTIHVVHRLFAMALLVSLSILAACLWAYSQLRRQLLLILSLTLVQVSLGISNVLLLLPLPLALLHNTGAALLLLSLVHLLFRLSPESQLKWQRTHNPLEMDKVI